MGAGPNVARYYDIMVVEGVVVGCTTPDDDSGLVGSIIE